MDAAEKANSKKPEIPNLRGAIFIRRKQYEEAAEQFSQALALDPKFYPAKLNLAAVDFLKEDYAGATKEYQALKEVDPDSELVDFQLMLCALLAESKTRRAEWWTS